MISFIIIFFYYYIMHSHTYKFSKVLDNMKLTPYQRLIIDERYINIVTSTEKQYFITKMCYFIFTNTITIGGVLVTSFSSFDRVTSTANITSNNTNIASNVFMWIVWILGILIAGFSGILQVFNIPKKYTLNYVVLEKLYSEGWSFAAGIGRYDKNIDDRFKLFCRRVEKIRIKSVEAMPDMGNRDHDDILNIGDDSDPNSTHYVSSTPRKSKNIFSKNLILPSKLNEPHARAKNAHSASNEHPDTIIVVDNES